MTRAQAGADAVGSDGLGDGAQPLARASKPMSALASWHLAHSWPLAQAHSRYGAYEHNLRKASPHSGLEKYKYQWSGTADWRRQAM